MNSMLLRRSESTSQGTPGTIIIGDFALKSIELPWLDNIRKVSCIPTGTYTVTWRHSPRFGMCYHVDDVPGRSGILIHAANFAGSTALGYFSQLEGCIAPCLRHGVMKNPSGVLQLAGLVSRPALDMIVAWADKKPFILTIENLEP